MKRILIAILLIASVQSFAQTVSEYGNLQKSIPVSVTTTAVTANANNLLSLDLSTLGYRSVTVSITGTWVATIQFQGSQDNFTTVDAIPVFATTSVNPTWQTSTTANGTFLIPTYGYRYIRVRTTAFTSGTINSTAYASVNSVILPSSNNSVTVTGSPNVKAQLQDNSGNGITSTGNALDINIKTGNPTSITANAGTNLNTSLLALETGGNLASIKTNTDNLNLAQASTTSGQKGNLNLGATTTAAPTYTTGQSNPLSLTTAGALRVDGSAVTQPVSGTFWQATQPVSISGNQAVNTAQINGVTPLMGNGVSGTGSQRVNIASDNTAFPINPLSATLPVSTMNSASANSGVNTPIAGVFDDVSPTAITENNFGFLRMSANRNLYGTIRDAAGNERGANVTAANELLVSVNNSSISVTQSTATNLKTQAESYQGGSAVGSGNPLQVTLANTGVNATALNVTNIVPTSGGYSVDSRTALTNTVVAAKATAGQVYGYFWYNPNTSAAYIQVFNVASGSVTLGTTSPTFVITIPASSGANVEFSNGIAMGTAISYAVTTTATGSTAPSSTLTGFMLYK